MPNCPNCHQHHPQIVILSPLFVHYKRTPPVLQGVRLWNEGRTLSALDATPQRACGMWEKGRKLLAEGGEHPKGRQSSPAASTRSGKKRTTTLKVGKWRARKTHTELWMAKWVLKGRWYLLAYKMASPVDSICYSRSTSTLAAGRRDGSVTAWDLRNLNHPPMPSQQEGDLGPPAREELFDCSPSWSFRRNTAGIECLAIIENISPSSPAQYPGSIELVGLLVGSADGLLCRIGLKPQGDVVLLEEFIGIESGDGIRGVQSVVVDSSEMVWCAADD
ncbi:16395_t:CDS:2, partial [Acaulospora colombiana]